MRVECITRRRILNLIKIIDEWKDLKMDDEQSNVIDLWNRPVKTVKAPTEPSTAFDEEQAKNKANADKLAKERLQANKKVLKEYRIK